MEQYLRVGVITAPHGLHGEVRVYPTTDDPARFKKLKKAWIDLGRERIPVTVTQAKFSKNMVILRFQESDSIEKSEAFRGRDLLVTRDQAVELSEDEYFIADLIGLQVVTDEGTCFGTVRDVMQTGANDVLVIAGADEKEYLFPFIRDCVRSVSLSEKTVTVHILDGLLDL